MSRYGSFTPGSSYAPSSYPYPPPRSRAASSSSYQSSSHAQPAFGSSYGPTFRHVNYDGHGSSAPYTHYQRPSATFGSVDYQTGGRSSYYRSISPGHGGRHDSDASYSREPLRRSFSTRRESSGYDGGRESNGSSRRYAQPSGGDRLAEARAAMMRERQGSTRSSYDHSSYGADRYGADHYGRRPAVSTAPLRDRAPSHADDYGRRAAISRTPLRDPDRRPPVSYREPRYESSSRRSSSSHRPTNTIIDDYWNRSSSGWNSYF
ncbi:hypothetical protein LTR27_008739 [Elasticomyces elasticus]|nr:hypothetical protein LTR27_008739 [Elasticomyces elasticus]